MEHWIFEFDIKVPWEPKMLIGRLCHASNYSSFRCQSNGAWKWGFQRPVPEVFPLLFRRSEREKPQGTGRPEANWNRFNEDWVSTRHVARVLTGLVNTHAPMFEKCVLPVYSAAYDIADTTGYTFNIYRSNSYFKVTGTELWIRKWSFASWPFVLVEV